MQEFIVKPKEPEKGPSVKIKADSETIAYQNYISSHGAPDCAVIVQAGGIFGYKIDFDDHLQEIEEKEQKEEFEKKKRYCLELAKKIRELGFSSVRKHEVLLMEKVLERSFGETEISEEEFELTKAISSDESAYRFFTLKSNSRFTMQQKALLQAMNVNLNNISSQGSIVQKATTMSAFAHSREIADDIREDLYGED